VLDVVPGKSIVAVKNVSTNEAYFQGHFPGHPVMPGVLILEALAQAGGVLAWESVSAEERIWILYLVGIEETRFKQTVRPGDQLVLRVELVKRKRNLWRFAARAEVDGKLVAETQILMADGPKS
jgi:3-hydroxyacyl-[acyl-carrier-protein] dehydratase